MENAERAYMSTTYCREDTPNLFLYNKVISIMYYDYKFRKITSIADDENNVFKRSFSFFLYLMCHFCINLLTSDKTRDNCHLTKDIYGTK